MKKIVKVNSEGRIIIPADIRKKLDIHDEDYVEIELTDGNEIVVNTITEKCQLCNTKENLNRNGNGDIVICDKCLETIKLNFKTIEEELKNE